MLSTLHRLRPGFSSNSPCGFRLVHMSLRGQTAEFLSGEMHPVTEVANAGEPSTSTSALELNSFQDLAALSVSSDQQTEQRTAIHSTDTSTTKEAGKSPATKLDRRSTKKERAPPKIIEPPKKKIEAFLQKIESEKDTLTLADVERHKPSKRPDQRSPEYEKEYNDAIKKLVRAFSLEQLQHIIGLYKLPVPAAVRATKSIYAATILEKQWKWTPFSAVQQSILDETELCDTRFALMRDEAFLLMGKDGSQLLKLSKHYDVHLSLSSDPMSIRVKGLQGSVKRFKGYLDSFIKDIEIERVAIHLSKTLTPETTQTISRLSGAYLTIENDKLRISYHKSFRSSAEIARRLAVQASSDETTTTTQAILIPDHPLELGHTLPFPHRLYPFFPQQEMSWKIPPCRPFRLRRVGHWLDTVHPTNSIGIEGLTEGSSASIFLSSPEVDLRSRLLSQIPTSASSSDIEVNALTGHYLFLSSASKRQSLIPPIDGELNTNDILRWTTEFPSRVAFNPSVPASILTYPPSEEHRIRQLIYVEVRSQEENADLKKILTFEWPEMQNSLKREQDTSASSQQGTCHLRRESIINLLVPDRAADMQFSAALIEEVPSANWPRELLGLFENFRQRTPDEHPKPPMTLTHDGRTYTLKSNTDTQRSHKKISADDTKKTVIIETALERESGQRNMACKITCKDYGTDLGWKTFLKQCDQLNGSI